MPKYTLLFIMLLFVSGCDLFDPETWDVRLHDNNVAQIKTGDYWDGKDNPSEPEVADPIEPVPVIAVRMLSWGDANYDGVTDIGDLGIMAANYGRDIREIDEGHRWNYGDFNRDGFVNVSDLAILAAHYGERAKEFTD